jgi:uncharacterized protein (UPF0335 family)
LAALFGELVELEEAQRTAECELTAIKNHRERIERLEQDKDEIMESYAKITPEALNDLSSQDRYRLYRMLRLKLVVNPDRSRKVNGALAT